MKEMSIQHKSIEIDAAYQFSLAGKYLTGNYIEKDIQKAYDLYLISAENNYALSQFNLGLMYENNANIDIIRNCPDRIEQAKKWYQKASEQNHPLALLNLGGIYLEKKSKIEIERAIKLFERSARLNCIDAMYNLAIIYQYSKEVPVDYKKAIYWYKEIINNENSTAQIIKLSSKGILDMNTDLINKFIS